MNRKFFYSLCFVFCNLLVCTSQEIKIQARIEYRKELNYLIPEVYGDSIRIPYLKLTYKNSSNKNYYFYNISLSPTMIGKTKPPKLIIKGNKAYMYSSCIANPFNEFLLDNLLNTKPPKIIHNVKFNLSTYSFDVDSLEYSMKYNSINKLFKNQGILDKYKSKKQYKYFSYPNKDYIDIMGLMREIGEENYKKEQCVKDSFTHSLTKKEMKNSKKFIFLRKGEEIARVVDLRVFAYLNWHGIIKIYNNGFAENINIEKYNSPCDLTPIESHKQSLPEKIGRYRLYEGKITGASVLVRGLSL